MAQPSGDDHHPPGLGQLSLVCLVVANMIGVGVFTTSGFALAGFTAAIAFTALAFEGYAAPFFPPGLPTNARAIALIGLAAILHASRLDAGATTQNIVVLLKVALILAFVAYASVVGVATPPPPATPFSTSAIAGTLVWISLSYSGFNAAVYVAGEARQPTTHVPRALWLGTALVTGLYLALNAIFLYLAPYDAVVNRADVAAAATLVIGGPTLESAIRAVITLASGSLVYGTLGRRKRSGA